MNRIDEMKGTDRARKRERDTQSKREQIKMR